MKEFNPNHGLSIRITHACNLKCSFCMNDWQMVEKRKNPDLLNIVDKMISDKIKEGNPYCTFQLSGGECFSDLPLLEEMLNLLLEYSGDVIPIRIMTNGTLLTSEIVDMINQFPQIQLAISIDGLHGERSLYNLVETGKEGINQINLIQRVKNKQIRIVATKLYDVSRDYALEIKMLHDMFKCQIKVAIDFQPEVMKKYSIDDAIGLQRIVTRLKVLGLLENKQVIFSKLFLHPCSCSIDTILPDGRLWQKKTECIPMDGKGGCGYLLRYMKPGLYELFVKIVQDSYKDPRSFDTAIDSHTRYFKDHFPPQIDSVSSIPIKMVI